MKDRRSLLLELVEARRPTTELDRELAAFAWDSEPLVELRLDHIATVLNRHLRRELSTTELEQWANAVECRDDLAFPAQERDLGRELLNELANPMLAGAITVDSVRRQLERVQVAKGRLC